MPLIPYCPHKLRGTSRMVASPVFASFGKLGFIFLQGGQYDAPKYKTHRFLPVVHALTWSAEAPEMNLGPNKAPPAPPPPPPDGDGRGEGLGEGFDPPPPPEAPSGHWLLLLTGPFTLLPNCPCMFPPTPYWQLRSLPYTAQPRSVVAFQTTWV